MRKWIVIAAVAVLAAVAIIAQVLRSKDSIEYHKKAYLAARGYEPDPLLERVREFVLKVVKNRSPGSARFQRRRLRMERHKRALLEAGYLTERAVVVSNRLNLEVMLAATDVMLTNRPVLFNQFFEFRRPGGESNIIRFIAVTEDASKVEAVIRKVDVAKIEKW